MNISILGIGYRTFSNIVSVRSSKNVIINNKNNANIIGSSIFNNNNNNKNSGLSAFSCTHLNRIMHSYIFSHYRSYHTSQDLNSEEKNRSYYEILEIRTDASDFEIKRAYYRLAKKMHPDLNKSDSNAQNRFLELNQAYKILINPEKRKKYDTGSLESEDILANDINYADFYDDALGSLFSFNRSDDLADASLCMPTYCTPVEAFEGFSRIVKYDRNIACVMCSGIGTSSKESPNTCRSCNGEGSLYYEKLDLRKKCAECDGNGFIIKDPCSVCEGSGINTQNIRLRINVPPGIPKNGFVKIPKMGNQGIRGKPTGDFYLQVKFLSNLPYEIIGDQIHVNVNISLFDAILGKTIEVNTIDNRELSVYIPPGTLNNDTIEVKGAGFPKLASNPNKAGSMFVHINIDVPFIRVKNVEYISKLDYILKDDRRFENFKCKEK